MDQAQLQKFTELLTALMSQDNAIRNAAEQQYQAIKGQDPNSLAIALVSCAAGPFDMGVKLEACVLLRQNMKSFNQKEFLYNQVRPEVQQTLRNTLLMALEAETNNAVRHRICDVVGELGSHLLADEKAGKWPELQPKLFQMLSGGNASQRESALRVLRELIPSVGMNLIKHHQEPFMGVLRQAMEDERIENRAQAVLIVCSIAEHLSAKFWKPFQTGFGKPMLKVIKTICDGGAEDQVQSCIEALIAVVEEEPLFFKPFLGDTIQLCFEIALARDKLEDGTRQLAFEMIVSFAEKKSNMCAKIPNFIPMAMRSCMQFMLELEESDVAAWSQRFSDSDDGEDASNYDVGLENVDRFAQSFGGDKVLPAVFALVGEFIRQSWQHKVSAIMTLSQCAEVIEDDSHTDAVVQLLLEQLKDPHPRVRYAALHALGQSSTDCSPHIQEAWHEQILPALTAAIDDPVLRVGSHACAAFVNFAEECDVDVLLPHMDVMMEKLYRRLTANNVRQVRENAITATAVIAGVTEVHFVKFYPHVMPLLKDVVLRATGPDERTLRGKAFECLSLLGIAVGKETFLPDAVEAMKAIVTLQQQNQLDDEEGTLKSFVFESLQRICKVLGTDFSQYLPVVLPPLLGSFSVQPSEVSDPEDQQDMTLMLLGNSKVVGLKTSHIEDLQSALTTVSTFVELLGGAGYKDFVRETAMRLMPLLEFQFDDEVKSLAITTWGNLVKCAGDVNDGPLAMDLLKGYLDYAFKSMPHEDDLDILEVQARGVSSCVSAAPSGLIDAAKATELMNLVFKLLEESFKRRKEQEQEQEEEDLDEDDLETAEQEKEKDESVRISLVEIGASLMKKHKPVFIQVAMPMFNQMIAKLVAPSNSIQDRSLALYVACDYLEHLGSDSVSAWPLFMEQLFSAVTDPNVQLRQAACYGINVASRIPEFATVAAQAVQRLLMTIEQPNSKSEDNIMATENAVAALGHVCEKHEAALGPNAQRCWDKWIASLPIKEDEDEGQISHAQLLRLVQAQHVGIIGANSANLPKVLHVLVQVYKRRSCSDDTSKGIAKLLVAIPDATLGQIVQQFPESDKKKAVRVVNEVRAAGALGM
jgi:HEAT repeat protein